MKNLNKGFSLIELLVVITLIGLLAMGVMKFDFNSAIDKQKIDVFTNEISSMIEVTRNNSLVGKGVGANLETPDSWKIEFQKDISVTNLKDGSIKLFSIKGGTEVEKDHILFDKNFKLNSIECIKLDDSAREILKDKFTFNIYFTGSSIGITQTASVASPCPARFKKIKIVTSYKLGKKKEIYFNSVNGVIEKNNIK